MPLSANVLEDRTDVTSVITGLGTWDRAPSERSFSRHPPLGEGGGLEALLRDGHQESAERGRVDGPPNRSGSLQAAPSSSSL